MSSQAYFDAVANQWDDMRQEFFPEAVREQALQKANVQAGQKAGDIGAGTGFLTEVLLQNNLDVIAVDPSEQMLGVMQDKFGVGDYRQGTAENLPIADETLDYAFANMVLHHTEQPAQAIVEMARVLKSGGKLLITDLDSHTFQFLVEEQHDRWMGFERAQIQSWFEAAGLQQISVESVGSNCCSDSECGTQRAEVSIFIAYGVKN